MLRIMGRDVFISLAAIAVVVLIQVRRSNGRVCSSHNLGIILFSMAMVVVFSLTGVSPISGFHTDIRLDEIAYIPFAGIKNMLQGGLDAYAVRNIAGNILLFLPLGFFLPLLWPKFRQFIRTVAYGFLVSVLIECSQLFLSRGTDVDDLILNTGGAVIGYLAFLIFRKLFPKCSENACAEQNRMRDAALPYLCTLIPYVVIVICGFYDRAVYLG